MNVITAFPNLKIENGSGESEPAAPVSAITPEPHSVSECLAAEVAKINAEYRERMKDPRWQAMNAILKMGERNHTAEIDHDGDMGREYRDHMRDNGAGT